MTSPTPYRYHLAELTEDQRAVLFPPGTSQAPTPLYKIDASMRAFIDVPDEPANGSIVNEAVPEDADPETYTSSAYFVRLDGAYHSSDVTGTGVPAGYKQRANWRLITATPANGAVYDVPMTWEVAVWQGADPTRVAATLPGPFLPD